jgi:K+-sensing histidine kinase KdpD
MESMHALAHDLRTPLSVIRGLAELTRTQLERRGEADLAERMRKIEGQVLRINRLLTEQLETG